MHLLANSKKNLADECSSLVTSTALPSDFYIFKLTQPLTVSTIQLLYTVKEKGGKPNRKPYPLPYGLRNPYRTSSLRTLKIMPINLNKKVAISRYKL